jgi:hypothetical protein
MSSHARAQTVEARLSQRVESFDSESSTTEGQLLDLARRFQIPIGLELIASAGNTVKAVHLANSTVLEALRTILKQSTAYDFDVTDGVVNIFLSSLVGDAKNFLNLRLSKFEIKNLNLIGARYYLKLAILQELHPKMNYGGGYGGVKLNSDLDIVKINLSTENLTVRQILNRLILAEGNAGWIVRLNPQVKMPDEILYAQLTSPEDSSVAPDFYWEFISLNRPN